MYVSMNAQRENIGENPEKSFNLSAPKHLRDHKILLVDDVEFSIIFLREIFRKAGFRNIYQATDGIEALNMTHEIRPDIVILDLLMPTMNGYEYIAEVQKDLSLRTIPILVQTASGTQQDKRKVFQAGASDFVSKPIEPFELLSRVAVHLQQRYLIHDITKKNQRIHEEVEQARRMQFDLLPTDKQIIKLEEQYPLHIVSLFRFSSELGGDMWNAQAIDASCIALTSVDFSGHGIAAALNTFRMDTVAQECRMYRHDAARYITTLNNRMHRLLPPEQFATLCYAVVDISAQTLSYTCAAPPVPIIIRANGNVEYLNNKGFPLGILRDAVYNAQTVPFAPGDALFIYSDALIETPVSADEGAPCISEKDLGADISALRCNHTNDNAYAEEVNAYCRSQYERLKDRLDDDLTILCFIYRRDTAVSTQ